MRRVGPQMTMAEAIEDTLKPEGDVPFVLIVEDDVALAEELSESVETAGFIARVAHSATEALQIIEGEPRIGLVVTDIMLGDLSGLELLRKLTKLGRTRKLRTVVCSGFASSDNILSALRLGVSDFLPKPVMPGELVEVLRREMQRQASARPAMSLQGSRPAQLMMEVRKKRDGIFGSQLFEDPAWNMLLDLHVSTQAGKVVTVSDLCLASGASATTALRRLSTLLELGLIERLPDPVDRRRVLVKQTPKCREAMENFSSWLRGNLDPPEQR